jgi:hypothetical protein
MGLPASAAEDAVLPRWFEPIRGSVRAGACPATRSAGDTLSVAEAVACTPGDYPEGINPASASRSRIP